MKVPKVTFCVWKRKEEVWRVYFYDHYQGPFLTDGNLDKEVLRQLSPYLVRSLGDFRIQLSIKTIPFMVGIFNTKHRISFHSPRLMQELFLLGFLPKNDGEDLRQYVDESLHLPIDHFPSMHKIITKRHNLPQIMENQEYPIDTKELETLLIQKLNHYRPRIFEYCTNYCLKLTASFALLRIHLLKFIAVLSSLSFDIKGTQVKRMLLETLRRLLNDSEKAAKAKCEGERRSLPLILFWTFYGIKILCHLLPAGLLANLVRFGVKKMARRFIAGENMQQAEVSLAKLHASGRDATLDPLGELVVSEQEADKYCQEVLHLIHGFSTKSGETNKAGIYKAHVSLKVSALSSDFKPEAENYVYQRTASRLKKILLAAKERQVFINIDAEHYSYRDLIFNICRRVLLSTPQLKDFAGVGMVIQAYLRDATRSFEQILQLAKQRKLTMPVRLVKGAYWDAETVEAHAHGFDAPQFLNKEETDLNFRQLIISIFKQWPHLQLCLASHNFSDHCYAVCIKNRHYPHLPPIEHQCLHMTYEALSVGMGQLGWVVRNYIPVGNLLVGMAYLVRRIMENSSQVGVLQIMLSHKKKEGLEDPLLKHQKNITEGVLQRDQTVYPSAKFHHAGPVRLYLEEHKKWVDYALTLGEKKLGDEYKNTLNGDILSVTSPSDPTCVVGKIRLATLKDAEDAVAKSLKAHKEWDSCWKSRAGALIKASEIMLFRRLQLAVLMCHEGGKTMQEALVDVDEAIDFLNFYAREEEKLQRQSHAPSSRGVAAVISPWNFPLAIPCGMTASSLAAGNTVILKSAKQTPLITQEMVDIFHLAGVPRDVLIHLPGDGRVVGEYLVSHSQVAAVIFTGSKAVGMRIAHLAGKRIVKNPYGHFAPVKIITEMGGKNAIIVTANAEPDETVTGILHSAFSHAGQKCSACSRVLVDNRIKDYLVRRLMQACQDLKVGKAFDYSTFINPIISEREKKRLLAEVEEAKREAQEYGGKVWYQPPNDYPGHCLGPVLIELPLKRAVHRESFAMRELFGPVLHIMGFDNFNEALEAFNKTEYALTGGIFSQSQDDIDELSSHMECGNIYINRNITGARVAVEPFGGFKLSGTGPKAGGESYLPSFHLNPAPSIPRDEKTSDFTDLQKKDISLCKPVHNSNNPKWLIQGITNIISKFEEFYPDESGPHMNSLKGFLNFLSVDFKEKEYKNMSLPGQLSFDNYTLTEEYLVVLAFNDKAFLPTLLQTLAALSLGLGVTVIICDKKAIPWWEKIQKIINCPKEHFDIFSSDKKGVHRIIKAPLLNCIAVDGNSTQLQLVLDTIYDRKFTEKKMKKIFSPYDAPGSDDFESYFKRLILVRSFAVNTMRHGAPFDLELS